MVITKKTYWLAGSIVLILVISLLTVVVNHKLNNRTTHEGMTTENFDRTISSLRNMLDYVVADKITEGETAFNEVADFFPVLDPVLAEKDPELGKQLMETVSQIKNEYGQPKPDQRLLLKYGGEIIRLLKTAKSALI